MNNDKVLIICTHDDILISDDGLKMKLVKVKIL